MSKHTRITARHELTADRRGTSAVEFAILSPIFLLILLGMAAYGIYFGASHSIQQIAADAARAAIAGLTEEERRDLASGFVRRRAGGYAFVDPKRLEVDVRDLPGGDGQFAVALSYDAAHLPIWNLFEGLPMPGRTISRRSIIRIGGL